MRIPSVAFFIGLTLALFGGFLTYEVIFFEPTVNTIFVMIILFFPMMLVGCFLMGGTIRDSDKASVLLFGSIWAGIMCFAYGTFMIWEGGQFATKANYQPMTARYSVSTPIILGVLLTGVPIAVILTLLNKTRAEKPEMSGPSDDPLNIRGKIK